MQVVWKDPLYLKSNDQIVMMPKGAKILSVQNQHDWITMWALIDRDAELEARRFRMITTGLPFDVGELVYLGTVLLEMGVYVFHLFEVIP